MVAQRAALGQGRWHFSHGPMDVIVQVEGVAAAVDAALESAWLCFEGLLAELVAELPLLRRAIAADASLAQSGLRGATARRMYAACHPFRDTFITPMAAVAGAVAHALIACCQGPGIRRAWANNGGDIALHLTPGTACQVGLYADLARLDAEQLREGLRLDGRFEVQAASPVRGIATSGWRGRSFSLGIADSVTVLAASAAQADAAASIIANAVDVDHPAIQRLPANQCRDDSDLGDLLVTREVPPLPPELVRQALHQGLQKALALQQTGLVFAAALCCQGQLRQTAWPPGLVLLPETSKRQP